MNSNRQFKVDQINEITKQLKNSNSLIVASYAGLLVKELQELKSELKKFNIISKVYKNRLFKLAIKDAKFESLKDHLIGQNIFIFGSEDENAPAKIVYNFSKKHESLKIKAGIYEDKVVDLAKLTEIANLPSFEEAIAMIATGLFAPIKNIAIGLNMLTKLENWKEK